MAEAAGLFNIHFLTETWISRQLIIIECIKMVVITRKAGSLLNFLLFY